MVHKCAWFVYMKTSDVEKQRETLGVKECLVRANLGDVLHWLPK